MRALGSQTATNIAFNPDVVSPPATPAIKGTYSPMKALNLLLRGSDLATQIDQRRMFVGLNGSHSQPRSAFVRLLLGT
jgi:hypothetical protein